MMNWLASRDDGKITSFIQARPSEEALVEGQLCQFSAGELVLRIWCNLNAM